MSDEVLTNCKGAWNADWNLEASSGSLACTSSACHAAQWRNRFNSAKLLLSFNTLCRHFSTAWWMAASFDMPLWIDLVSTKRCTGRLQPQPKASLQDVAVSPQKGKIYCSCNETFITQNDTDQGLAVEAASEASQLSKCKALKCSTLSGVHVAVQQVCNTSQKFNS